MHISSSETLIEGITKIIETNTGLIADTPMGTLYRGPKGGYEHKTLFVGSGDTIEERKQNCLRAAEIFRVEQIKIHHRILDEYGALIIDPPTTAQLNKLQTE